MIESDASGRHVFRCGLGNCPYERILASPVKARAISAWHVYEKHPVVWATRNGTQSHPRDPRPVEMT